MSQPESAPLRILSMGQSWPAVSPGGLNRYVADLHAALPGAGGQPTTLVLGPLPDPVAGVVVCAPENAPLPIRVVSLARATWSRLGHVDVVAPHFALYGLVPAFLARLRRVPVVVHFHGPWAGEARAQGERSMVARWKARLESRVYRRADALIVASPAFRDLLSTDYGVPTERITVVTPGVDLERFRPSVRPADATSDDVDFVAFTARRLVARMGLDVLIDAWPADPGAMLVIAGDGPDRATLEQRAVGKNIRFLGRVSDDELRDWYGIADVVTVPSVALEGFGLVVLESLACGTPVIASRTGGLTSVLPQLDDDLLLEPGDVAVWADRLSRARAGQLPSSERCRTLAERFSLHAFGSEAAVVYRRVVEAAHA